MTLDTNVVGDTEVLSCARSIGADIAVVTVTQRELENTDFAIHLEPLDAPVNETGVWNEGRWGMGVWGGRGSRGVLDRILAIITSGSFPKDRSNLSAGQRRQLRDGIILEAHVREGRDILVSNDERAFIRHGKGKQLCESFGIRVLTAPEFKGWVAQQTR